MEGSLDGSNNISGPHPVEVVAMLRSYFHQICVHFLVVVEVLFVLPVSILSSHRVVCLVRAGVAGYGSVVCCFLGHGVMGPSDRCSGGRLQQAFVDVPWPGPL